jgi:succinate dehydrogenase / fumarate reductase cytochrome b subunit
MSTAVEPALERTYGFYELSPGKKAVMAVTGVILFGYVIGHLAGNLQLFAGREMINRYAHFLHGNPGPLWAARVVLLAAVALHIWTSYQLWALKRRARPIRYHRKDDVPAAYAARTMLWSGPIIAAFVVFHVLHLTVGSVPGLPLREVEGGIDVYYNVVVGFRNPLVTASYIVAIVLLTMHLYHGVWSMFQSIGLSHPRYTPLLKGFAQVGSILIAAGYISIPVAVMLRVIGGEVL